MKKTIKLKIKGIKGEKGDTPSTDELVSIITPLIPEPIKGDTGADGRNPLTVSSQQPSNPQIGDLWYQI